jgi:hypothetical protein
MRLILAIFLMVMVTGCATQKTVDMAESYNSAYVAHVANDQMAQAAKSAAIKDAFSYECKDNTEACGVAKALGAVIAAREIAGIQPAIFNLPKHATDVDAQMEAVKVIGKGIPFITMGVVASKAIDSDNGTVNNSADNGSTVTSSTEENHATNLGENGTSSNYPGQDNSTEVAEAVSE